MKEDDIDNFEEVEETSQEMDEESGEMLDEDNIAQDELDKYSRLVAEGDNKHKLAGMYKDWFLDYASYVILERAVPHIEDGLKPVQRRILHAMYKVDDGHFHKVAGIVGDTMKYHPHGDASIKDALVGLGQKDFLVDCQGNWGNIFTGDSAAASRYIEARLSKFALEVAFNKKITDWVPSYDGTNQEPVVLPVKFPLLLAQGTEGIAVGLAVKILPHNFNELLDASIAALREHPFEIFPDFPTGGLMDCSKYNKGLRGGKIKIRARIVKTDKHTLTITEIPYGQTTGSLIDSIIKANEKGKIKIKKIDDMSSDGVEINIQLQNEVSPDKTIDALYAFTNCEVAVSPSACVILDRKPQFMGVDEILRFNAFHTKELFHRELEIVLSELEEEWHYSSLEKIFFEQKVFRILENDAATWEQQLDDVEAGMKKFQHLLRREITREDINKLVEKPVRKISHLDIKAVEEKIRSIDNDIEEVKNNLDHLVEYTIRYYQQLKRKYGSRFPRKTEISTFENIQAEKVVTLNAKLYANMQDGFVGTDQKKIDGAEYVCDCSDIAEIVAFMKNGKYLVTKVKDKAFIGKDIIHVAVFNRKDERTVYNVIYRDGRQGVYYAKRFAITGVTRDKEYDLTMGTPDSTVVWFTANGNGEAETLKIHYRHKPKLKKLSEDFDFSKILIKGRSSRGNVVTSKNSIQRINLKSQGVSTLAGRKIWFDSAINRLTDTEHGIYLGEFAEDDKILVVCSDGSYYTTSFDLNNHYQGDIIRIEKYEEGKIFSAIYYDGAVKAYYIKRFTFEVNSGVPSSFISDGKGSRLLDISEDRFPQIEVTFGGKNEGRASELIDVDEFIGLKSYKAKGKKVSSYEIATVAFGEPLEKEIPEDEAQDEDVNEEFSDEPEQEETENEDPGQTPDFVWDNDSEEPTLF